MSSLLPAIASERQSPDEFTVVRTSPATAEPVGTDGNGQAAEYPEAKSVLPFFLIGSGIAIYFIAIAAFASFPGVAVGVFVMVLGGTLYACRGLLRPPHSSPDTEAYSAGIDSMPDPFLSSFSTQPGDDTAPFEPTEEPESETAEVLAVH